MYLDKIRKVLGPYLRKDGRKHVLVYLLDGTKMTISYPKYLMELHLNRELDPDLETIDHIDRDFNNNELSNLQILTRQANASKSAKRLVETEAECLWCSSVFILSKSQSKNRNNGKSGPFCSKACCGKYGKSVQLGALRLENNINVKYYRKDDKII